MNKEIKIYVSCHKPSTLPQNKYFLPIQVGAKNAKVRLENMLHDDVGDNISEKNPMYCELTAQYWAWKNDSADYFGFCHYRRYFSFSKEKYVEDAYGTILHDYLDASTETELALNDDAIEETVLSNDFIIGAPSDFSKHGINNLYEQYESATELHVEDLHTMMAVLKEKHPAFSDAADEYMDGCLFYPCNMFVMKRELFHEYSEWLFSILEEVEKRIDSTFYSIEGLRTIGHLAERLLGIFFTYVKTFRPNVKTSILQRTLILRTDPMVYPKPAYDKNDIPIMFCCNNNFVPYLAATIKSLAMHTNEVDNYDIMLMHRDISQRNQELLLHTIKDHPNVSLRFLDISAQISNLNLIANNHISVDTFYRLLVAKIFRHFNKIVYLDSDLIILSDVAELYRIDMEDKLIAATIDADHFGQCCGATPGVMQYCEDTLHMENPYDYFQAGVLIFNITEMSHNFKENELIEFAQTQEFMYLDQDILNVKCEGKVKFLDPMWNVLVDNQNFRMNHVIKKAPANIYFDYLESRKNPYIIHYAGAEKPWTNPLSDYAYVFWEYARMTPFYEAIIYRAFSKNNEKALPCPPIDDRTAARKFADILLPMGSKRRELAKCILPRDSLRWRFCKAIYLFFRPQDR